MSLPSNVSDTSSFNKLCLLVTTVVFFFFSEINASDERQETEEVEEQTVGARCQMKKWLEGKVLP